MIRRRFLWVLAAAWCATAAAQVTVTVSPVEAELRAGQARTFSASVKNAQDRTVQWLVNGVAGGNATIGTVTEGGRYTAPLVVPKANTVTVTAQAKADPKAKASAKVILLNPVPAISGTDPWAVNTALPFTMKLSGRSFVPGAFATFGGVKLATTYVSDTQLVVTGMTAAPPDSQVPLIVTNPNPGSAASSVRNVKVLPPVGVSVWPNNRTVRGGVELQLSHSISNNGNKGVKWYVNNVAGGNAVFGAIDAAGKYTAPLAAPSPPQVAVKAVSDADPKASATVAVKLLNALPVLDSVNPGTVAPGPVSFRVRGSGFVRGAVVRFGTETLTTTYLSPVELEAAGSVKPAPGGRAAVRVANPDPGGAESAMRVVPVEPARIVLTRTQASRFLEQAAWGATPELLARVQQVGREAFLAEQLAAPPSDYPDAQPNMGLSAVQRRFFSNAMTAPDQLRQRMAFALGQILVVSGVKTGSMEQMVPYQRILLRHAFGNFLDLLRDVTLSPAMGHFLDMVNNEKENPAKNLAPNENYARELLQLFTIGLHQLNADGTTVRDAAGNPVSAYTEETVKEFTKAFTGWTYAPRPGAASKWRNPSYFAAPMEPFETHHDTSAKALLNGVTLPAGQLARADLEAALRNIFEHPNVGPFISLRLIQHLVKSNPSPAYVARISAVFANNGSGVRGDLAAVARAILLDAEARPAGRSGQLPDAGQLREPVRLVLTLLRALDTRMIDEPSLASWADQMGQRLFYAPSVFNYYSPFYRIPGSGAGGPEFQILTPATAVNRANFAHRAVRNSLGGTVAVDITPFQLLASDPEALVEAVNHALLGGTMSSQLRQSILRAVGATTDLRTRARNALYLGAVSAEFQVAN
ncbi:MAG: DUF1800 family protein [Bryobacterales bacterium]|nr:DUF1800 family protein [Bryobacterales bacterium]